MEKAGSRALDESQTLLGLFSIATLIAFRSIWWIDQSDLFVVANRRHFAPVCSTLNQLVIEPEPVCSTMS